MAMAMLYLLKTKKGVRDWVLGFGRSKLFFKMALLG